VSHDVWDDESWSALSARLIELAREAGALTVLSAALRSGAGSQLLAGEFAVAASIAEEAEAVARAMGNPAEPYGRLMLAAWRGQDAEARQLIAATTAQMVARGEGQWLTAAHWAAAVLANSLGRYDEALAAAEQCSECPDELGLAVRSMSELIEAAARTGAPERGIGALRRLVETTSAAGTDWALGVQARSRALLGDGESADRLYREAIERLGGPRVRTELARAHLLYGEWLKRENRRVDAREQLRAAHRMLTAMGPRDSPNGPGVSCCPPVKWCAGTPPRRPPSSPRKRRRSPGSLVTGIPTRRSVSSCSSAHARSSGTCARYSPSSESALARNSAGPGPTSSGPACWPSHSTSSSRRFVLASSTSSSPPPDRIVLVAYRVKPLISP
jgi:tetratricopeptide (TPR) repeat protein